jgi:hypothetical protein
MATKTIARIRAASRAISDQEIPGGFFSSLLAVYTFIRRFLF